MLAVEAQKSEDKSTEWTTEEDAILIGMKAQNKPWKEIYAVLKGKTLVKERYKQLVKGKEEEEAKAKKEEAKAKEEAEKKEAKIAEHKKRKEEKAKAWKEKEAKEKEAKEKDAKEKEAKEKEAKEKKAESKEKKGKGKEKEAEKSTPIKRPVLYLDEAGGLDFKEVSPAACGACVY